MENEIVNIAVSRNNFKLEKVKFDGTKVIVKGKVKMSVNGGVLQEKKINEEIENYPHPDFVQALANMKPDLLEEWNFNHSLEAVENFKAKKDLDKGMTKAESAIVAELEQYLINEVQLMSEKVTVTGASVAGKNPGIVITGKNKPDDKQIAMLMPRRNFEMDEQGNAGDLMQKWQIVEEETFALLYKGKQAQQDIFNAQEAEPEEKGIFDDNLDE